MYKIFRWFVFKLDAEKAHYLTLDLLNFIVKLPGVAALLRWIYAGKPGTRRVFGLDFQGPVGLAAGLDKNAKYIEALSALGFGHIEVGTVTPKAQPGNDKPRLFRLIPDEAIVNRMGFNNEGVEAMREHILAYRKRHPHTQLIIGGNIGKNKATPNEEAVRDYEICFERLFDVVDYFVVNVSSPNTPDLRALQDKEPLMKILGAVQAINAAKPKPKPLLLKIAPDLSDGQLDDIAEIAVTVKLDGIIATNTTIARDGLTADRSVVESIGAGGLSGKPLTARATAVIRYLHTQLPQLPLIASGGVMSREDARAKLDAGATLVQVYTGFIYAGPALIRDINSL